MIAVYGETCYKAQGSLRELGNKRPSSSSYHYWYCIALCVYLMMILEMNTLYKACFAILNGMYTKTQETFIGGMCVCTHGYKM